MSAGRTLEAAWPVLTKRDDMRKLAEVAFLQGQRVLEQVLVAPGERASATGSYTKQSLPELRDVPRLNDRRLLGSSLPPSLVIALLL